jgi:hypothetical protein
LPPGWYGPDQVGCGRRRKLNGRADRLVWPRLFSEVKSGGVLITKRCEPIAARAHPGFQGGQKAGTQE